MLKTTRNMVFIFFIVLVLGCLLLTLSYMIPSENAFNQINHNADDIQDISPCFIPTYDTTKYDMYTDKIILSQISYYNHNVSLIENAMGAYRTDPGNFSQYLDGDESSIHDHPQYWHGNMVVYKPIFYFLDYNGFKILDLFLELALIIFVLKLMIDRNLKNFCIPLILSLFLIHVEVIGTSLQYSPMLYITLISIIILLKYKEYLFKDNRLFYYFLVIGMATSYFDLLTYPLVSFAIPMIFYLLIEEDKNNLKDNFVKIVLFAVVWAIGYIGMWGCKWIIGSIILKEDVISIGLNKIFFRMNPNSYGEFSRFDAIMKNVLIYKKRGYFVIFALTAVYYVKRIIPSRKNINKVNLKHSIPLLIMASSPFIWYFVCCNHSYIHYWFTYRELWIFFFAILCVAEYLKKSENY